MCSMVFPQKKLKVYFGSKSLYEDSTEGREVVKWQPGHNVVTQLCYYITYCISARAMTATYKSPPC